MEDKVLAYLNRREMTAPGLTVCVGFSGGADSVALLQLLWENRKRMGIRVKALHMNHGIRGSGSAERSAVLRDVLRGEEDPYPYL